VKIALLLIGFGNVARRFVRLIEESRADLDALGIEPIIVGITTARHGSVFEVAGLDAVRAAQRIAEGRGLGPALAPSTLEFVARLRSQGVETRMIVETTPLDIRFGEPALSHVRAGFAAGAHVVTANKGPVAFAYRSLQREAADAGVSFLFEGAVMDGVPIFSLVRETMPASRVLGFRGVVNSTTNFLLTALERRESFDAAVARMQAEGIAEADPSLDVDGWDAAAKTAALANVWLDARMTPHDVEREGVTPAAGDRARAAISAGRRLKLVASAMRDGTGVRARVSLEELPADDPLAILDGQGNAIEIDTWPLGRLVITQRDGGLEKTAYALLSDMITVARRVRGDGEAGAGNAEPAGRGASADAAGDLR
jgi:homoserine dehydrogenase